MSALSSLQGSMDGAQPAVPVSPAPVAAGKASGKAAAAATPARARVRTTPLLGRLSLKWQSIILLGALAITVGAAIAISAYERQSDRVNALQNEVVGDALMHSQRLAKAANMAVQGNEEAYDQLKSSQAFLSDAVKALKEGGEVDRLRVSPLPESYRTEEQRFSKAWDDISPSVKALSEQQDVLVRFDGLVNEVAALERELSASQRAARANIRDGAGNAPDLLLFSRLSVKMRTIVGEIIRMHGSSQFDSRDAVSLADAIESFAVTRETALDGDASHNIAPLKNTEAREALRKNNALAAKFVRLALEAQKALPALAQARHAGMDVFKKSDVLMGAANALRARLIEQRNTQNSMQWAILGFASAYYDDSKIQADRSIDKRLEAERLEQEASRINDQNQAAILRLMNELQNVADGDLTVQATVSDDITGAIADSINYTVEELRSLVGRINRTAAAVAEASASAQVTASHLQAVSEQQSREIRETGEAVLNMAAQIKQVSASASESAEVARQSLSAASRGRDAVQNAIAGMGGIREQIQDTAKRIKRLGESSQEIGEIVELISNITEQTNVLALNAAIQAASAGEAGRGFTVVAEEVQRLAERSAEATRQISALVKAIQTDTHDAVAAMERSTQGVVRGAKLSDEAGMALIGIGQVSQELADLIMRISRTTENQAASASSVAQSIQRILLVNSQTNEGTQQTAGSILQLSELARELKNSVARFRVG